MNRWLSDGWQRSQGRAGFAATVLAAAALTGWIMPAPPAPPPTQLVRWVGDGHDWVLVGDRGHDRIRACDVRDGRPLGTLDRASGLSHVDRMVLEGDWRVVLRQVRPRLVRLPSLQVQPWAMASPARR